MAKEPTIFEKAANFAVALTKHVATGMPTLTEDKVKIRLDICDTCPEVNKSTPNWTCTKCGCNLKVKASWAGQDCPIKKWPAIT